MKAGKLWKAEVGRIARVWSESKVLDNESVRLRLAYESLGLDLIDTAGHDS